MDEQPQPPVAASSLATTPPRLLLALALVGAAGLILVAAVLAMVTVGLGGVLGADLGLLQRLQFGTGFLDIGVLLLVPLAVLLARLVEPDAGTPAHPAVRSVVLGASAVGPAALFLILLRVLSNLGVSGVPPGARASVLLADIGHLLVACAGAWWAYQELQRLPRASEPHTVSPPDPGSGPGSFSARPPTGPIRPGFPTGPPPAPDVDGGQAQR